MKMMVVTVSDCTMSNYSYKHYYYMQYAKAMKHALLKRSMFEEYRSAGLKRTSPMALKLHSFKHKKYLTCHMDCCATMVDSCGFKISFTKRAKANRCRRGGLKLFVLIEAYL